MQKLLKKFLNILIPQKCILCNRIVDGSICGECWSNINFISKPYCEVCHLPFEYEIGDSLCLDCAKNRPAYTKAYSVFVYDEFSKPIITKFKYGDAIHFMPHLAKILHAKTQHIKADFIIPVPLHYKRLVSRRYNQAGLLASGLGKVSKRYAFLDALIRKKNTPPQAGLIRIERNKNIAGAFGVNPKHAHILKGKNVILVDDVMTTGATIEECAKVLKKCGVKNIYTATIARTVIDKKLKQIRPVDK